MAAELEHTRELLQVVVAEREKLRDQLTMQRGELSRTAGEMAAQKDSAEEELHKWRDLSMALSAQLEKLQKQLFDKQVQQGSMSPQYPPLSPQLVAQQTPVFPTASAAPTALTAQVPTMPQDEKLEKAQGFQEDLQSELEDLRARNELLMLREKELQSQNMAVLAQNDLLRSDLSTRSRGSSGKGSSGRGNHAARSRSPNLRMEKKPNRHVRTPQPKPEPLLQASSAVRTAVTQLRKEMKRRCMVVSDLHRSGDADRSNRLTQGEFADAVHSVGVKLEKKMLHEVFQAIDSDGDGHISFQELAAMLPDQGQQFPSHNPRPEEEQRSHQPRKNVTDEQQEHSNPDRVEKGSAEQEDIGREDDIPLYICVTMGASVSDFQAVRQDVLDDMSGALGVPPSRLTFVSVEAGSVLLTVMIALPEASHAGLIGAAEGMVGGSLGQFSVLHVSTAHDLGDLEMNSVAPSRSQQGHIRGNFEQPVDLQAVYGPTPADSDTLGTPDTPKGNSAAVVEFHTPRPEALEAHLDREEPSRPPPASLGYESPLHQEWLAFSGTAPPQDAGQRQAPLACPKTTQGDTIGAPGSVVHATRDQHRIEFHTPPYTLVPISSEQDSDHPSDHLKEQRVVPSQHQARGEALAIKQHRVESAEEVLQHLEQRVTAKGTHTDRSDIGGHAPVQVESESPAASVSRRQDSFGVHWNEGAPAIEEYVQQVAILEVSQTSHCMLSSDFCVHRTWSWVRSSPPAPGYGKEVPLCGNHSHTPQC